MHDAIQAQAADCTCKLGGGGNAAAAAATAAEKLQCKSWPRPMLPVLLLCHCMMNNDSGSSVGHSLRYLSDWRIRRRSSTFSRLASSSSGVRGVMQWLLAESARQQDKVMFKVSC
jgi:hypothetical protein